MEHLKFGLLIFSIVLLATEVAMSTSPPVAGPVPGCDSANAEMPRGTAIDIAHLPALMLVGREAQIRIHTANSDLRAAQNFIHPESKVLCASTGGGSIAGVDLAPLSISAPVLLDLTGGKENSVWNFQFLIEGSKIGTWNQASKLLSRDFKLQKYLQSGVSVRATQLNHDQYELVFTKPGKGGSLEEVSIIYDAITQ